MNLVGPGLSTLGILFFVLIFRLGIVAVVVDRPNWNRADWERELENDLRKHRPDGIGEYSRIIPDLIECALNTPQKSRSCSDNFRTALLNEILLRKQFKNYNEDCNSGGTKESELVLNPPRSNGMPFSGRYDLDYPSYLIWQEKLINSKLHFCDPHEFLRCSTGRKCVCHLGTVRVEVENRCLSSRGSPCMHFIELSGRTFGKTGQEPLYLDPFQRDGIDSDRTIPLYAPACVDESRGGDCLEGFQTSYHRDTGYCIGDEVSTRTLVLRVRDYFQFLRPLEFNEECNFQDHNRLFTSTKEEDANFEVRFNTIEEIQRRGTKFCDFEKFLTCGPSEKCECISPSTRKGNKCVFQTEKCGINVEMKQILMNKTLVPRARRKLLIGFVDSVSLTTCEGNLTCQADEMEMYCFCPPGTTGQVCEVTLTRFLSRVSVQSLPTDVAGYIEKIKILSHFNNKAFEFEKLFRWEGTSCHWESQNAAEILVGRFQKLMYRGTRMTKRQYEDLGKKIQVFTAFHQRHRICNHGLRCQFSTKTCVNQTRRDYLEDLVKKHNKSRIHKCDPTGCSKLLRRFDDDMYGGNEYLFYGGDYGREYDRILEEHSKFCLACQVYKSIAPYCYLPCHFILLFSVAMMFILSNC